MANKKYNGNMRRLMVDKIKFQARKAKKALLKYGLAAALGFSAIVGPYASAEETNRVSASSTNQIVRAADEKEYEAYFKQLAKYCDEFEARDKQIKDISKKFDEIEKKHLPALMNASSNITYGINERMNYLSEICRDEAKDVGLLGDYLSGLRQADTNSYEKALQTLDSIILKYQSTLKVLGKEEKK